MGVFLVFVLVFVTLLDFTMAETAVAISRIPDTVAPKKVIDFFTEKAGKINHSFFQHEASGMVALFVFDGTGSVAKALKLDKQELEGFTLTVGLISVAQIGQLDALLEDKESDTLDDKAAQNKAEAVCKMIEGMDEKTKA